MKLSWSKYRLQFRQRAGTSRGELTYKDSWFIKLTDQHKTGWGECGMLRGLSADDRPDYEAMLNWLAENIHLDPAELFGSLAEFPSIQFGLEMALRDLEVDDHHFFDTDFTRGKAGQPINGLIWMGDEEFMRDQIKKRLAEGFTVLKMKIGAIDWPTEKKLLTSLRNEFNADELTLRVDANGAFNPANVGTVLDTLANLSVHSIEQPLAKGQWDETARICEESPVPVALDEELIGIFSLAERRRLMQHIRPPFIILKPSFVGGWRGSEEWINLAGEYGAEWWVTSALESNFGLSAIAQWNSTMGNNIPSGLGTGSLYTNNIPAPLRMNKGNLYYDPEGQWDLTAVLS